jgi:AhpD family alkylhydroperoxidase
MSHAPGLSRHLSSNPAMETDMTRLDPWTVAPDQVGRLVDYSIASGEGMDPGLKALVKIRASQINGCARCLHMHIGEGRKAKVTTSASIWSAPGARPRSTARANAPPWPGPRP